MARGSNSRDGRVARSEMPKLRVSGGVSMDDSSVSERFFNEYRDKALSKGGRFREGMSKDNLFKIGDALDEIKQKVLPTGEIRLSELTEREQQRFLGVKDDNRVGYLLAYNTDSNKKLQADFKELREKVQAAGGKDTPYDQADKLVVNMANDILEAAYLGGRRDFSIRASYFFDGMTKKYGEDLGARLTRASLREAFNRMSRAGMIYQEKDPRFKG